MKLKKEKISKNGYRFFSIKWTCHSHNNKKNWRVTFGSFVSDDTFVKCTKIFKTIFLFWVVRVVSTFVFQKRNLKIS